MKYQALLLTCLAAGCVNSDLKLRGPDDMSEDVAAVDHAQPDMPQVNNVLTDMEFPPGDMTPDLDEREVPRFTSIAMANRAVCVVETGTARVFCWGANEDLLLGAGDVDRHAPSLRLGFPEFEQLVAGRRHMCGFTDGSVECWGDNALRQSGVSAGDLEEPNLVLQDVEIDHLSAGDVHTCAVYTGGQTWCWGANLNGMLNPSATFDGCTMNSECNVAGEVCFRTRCTGRFSPTSVAPQLMVREVAAGDAHTCVLTAEREVHCWGQNTDGRAVPRLNDTLVTDPTPTNLGQFSTIRARGFTCGLVAAGAQCWGDPANGQLGAQPGNPVPGTAGAIDLAVGNTHACVLLSNGTVRCWGQWKAGAPEITTFTPPTGQKFLALGVGKLATCASTQTDLYCWGENGDLNENNGTIGQFSDSLPIDETYDEPTRVPLD